MNFISFLIVVFLCKIFVSETIAWDENSLSRTVTTRNHRRLKGFTFNTFHSASLVSCGLKCQRNPRCASTNFRKVTSSDETEGVCELNDKGVESPIEGKELQYDEETVYSQFSDMKVRERLIQFEQRQTSRLDYFVQFESETKSKLDKLLDKF